MNETEASRSTMSVVQSLPWFSSRWSALCEQHRAGKLAHAYLVTGEQGIGKFELICALANYMLCQHPADDWPCGNCVNCQLGNSGQHPDLLVIQPEEGSRDIKVDQIRNMSEFVSKTTHSGMLKIVLLNPAHHLNASAANGLLKTLEEPTKNTFIFLISERADSLPATLRSRCQRLLLPTPGLKAVTEWLEERDMDPHQAKRLALAAANRPFHALAMAEDNGIARADEFLKSLIAVRQHNLALHSCVATGMSMGDLPAIEYLVRTSSIVSKALALNEPEATIAADALLTALVATFASARAGAQTLQHVLLFNSECERALRQLRSGTNPNPQLVLESLLWQWCAIGTRRFDEINQSRTG